MTLGDTEHGWIKHVECPDERVGKVCDRMVKSVDTAARDGQESVMNETKQTNVETLGVIQALLDRETAREQMRTEYTENNVETLNKDRKVNAVKCKNIQ